MAKLTKEDIIEALSSMTMMEIADLVKAVEEHFGVSAAAPVAVAAAAPVEAEANAGPTEVSVILKSAGTAKIPVIKIVKELLEIGLADAKKLVESAPVAIKEKISPAEAEEIKAKLVEAGAEVEIK